MKYKLTEKHHNTIFELIIILICLILWIPVFQIIQYNIPGASDDFFHGFFLNDKPYFEAVKYWYESGYNGRYANALLMQLPGRPYLEPAFGKVFPWITFLLLYFSQTFFIRSITRQFTWTKTIMTSTLLLTFFFAFIPSMRQFYWFSGLTVYILPMIFYYLVLGIFMNRFNNKQNFLTIFTIIISFFVIIGSNENWMIMSLLTVLTFTTLELIKKKKLTFFTYFVILYTLILSYFIIFSPGTAHRLEMEGTVRNNQDFFASLTTAIFHISRFFKAWFIESWFIIGALFVFLLDKPRSTHDFRLKIPNHLAIIGVLMIIFAGISIMLFSLGFTNPIRIRGLIPVFFVSSLLLLYCIYRISQSKLLDPIKNQISNSAKYSIIIFLLILSISNSQNLKNINHDINTGNAKKLAEQTEFLINYIKASPQDTVIVPNITIWSEVLYPIQISEKTQGFNHWITSTYFNKKVLIQDKSITIEEFMHK